MVGIRIYFVVQPTGFKHVLKMRNERERESRMIPSFSVEQMEG